MIINTNQLDTSQLVALEELIALCKKSDGSVPNVYPHILSQQRALPASLLYYEKQQLLGFLSAFFFYEHAVEIALIIHPSARRQGLAHQLLASILSLVNPQEYNHFIFSTPAHLNDKWLLAKGFSYLHSEYCMARHELTPLLNKVSGLDFRKANLQDVIALRTIDEACFPQHLKDSAERFSHMMEGRHYQIIIAIKDNQIIGKAHLRWEDKGATLSDIAILPSFQGAGFGTALISHCINEALIEGKPHLTLDVETHNLKALNLYSRLGFLIQNACDYWEISIKNLQHFSAAKKSLK